MKAMRGTRYLSACRQTVSDCGSTPPTPQNTATAPSSTRRLALDLDGEVDVPGRVDDVDAGIRQKQVVEAAVMVMPRSCSCSIQSIWVGALVDLAHLVGHARVVEDPLGRRGLTRVDVRHDPDVPGLSDRVVATQAVECLLRARVGTCEASKS